MAIRSSRRLLALAGILLLGACSSIRGAPVPVTDVNQERSDLALYLGGDVLAKFYSSDSQQRGGMTPQAWRDSVIAARLEIADQEYQVFKNRLNAEAALVSLGTSLVALGVSGAAAVAGQGAAQALSAASTGVQGAGTAFNKDVLYAKTLPAIFAQMDADRTTVLVRIRGSQQLEATKFPLSSALTDLTAYERAGTLEGAIEGLTTSATNQATAQKRNLALITGLAVLPTEIAARAQKFSDYIQSLVTNNQKSTLDQIAVSLGAATDANITTERTNILRVADKLVYGSANPAQAITDLSQKLMPITQQPF